MFVHRTHAFRIPTRMFSLLFRIHGNHHSSGEYTCKRVYHQPCPPEQSQKCTSISYIIMTECAHSALLKSPDTHEASWLLKLFCFSFCLLHLSYSTPYTCHLLPVIACAEFTIWLITFLFFYLPNAL